MCLLVAGAAWLFVFKASRRMPDFLVYWQVGVRAAHAEPLYRVSDDQYQFKYFPAFGMLAIPIGALPLRAAKVVWFCALIAALVLLLRLTLDVLPELRIAPALLVSALLISLGKYYVIELVIGQINLLFALVIVAAMVAFKNGREVFGGLLVALAIAVKPYGLILVPWLLARRRIPAVVAALAGTIGFFWLPAIVYGVRGAATMHLEWWRTVRDTTSGTLSSPDNVSLASMFTKWFGATPAAAWFTAVTAVLLLAAAAVVMHRRDAVPEPDGLEVALVVMLTPLLSPQGWGYVLVVSTPAIAYLVNYMDTLPRVLRWVSIVALGAIGLTLFDLMGRRLYYALVGVSITTICFLIVIALLVTLRVRKTV